MLNIQGGVQDIWLDQEDVQLLKDGEEVTLMDWGNAFVERIHKSPDGSITGQMLPLIMLGWTSSCLGTVCLLQRTAESPF